VPRAAGLAEHGEDHDEPFAARSHRPRAKRAPPARGPQGGGAMNKLCVFVRLAPGAAAEQTWAALASELEALCSGPGARHIRRAAASSRIEGASVPGVTLSELDGLLELWFAGPGRLDATAGDPVWRARLDAALTGRTVPESTVVLGTQEVLQLDRAEGAVKVIGLAARSDRFPTRWEWSSYWRDVHSPLVHSIPEVTRHYRRYVHDYVVGAAYGTGGMEPPYDGISEEWFDSVEDYAACIAEPEYAARVRPDDEAFIDLERSHLLITRERVVHSA
jgi:uncharacterized protein (TIGR02118 family)